MTGLLFLFGASVLVGLVDVARRNHNLNRAKAAAEDAKCSDTVLWLQSMRRRPWPVTA